VKPGDFGEVTLSYHLFGNPGFASVCAEELADDDNGILESEDKVNGHTLDESDGTEGGDLGEHVQAQLWYDPNCDNRFAGDEQLIAQGTLNEVIGAVEDCLLLDPRASGGAVASDFEGTLCHAPSNTGCLALAWWLPRDIPGVNDNIIQTDRYEFTVSFNAVQCRHNTTDDGEPIDEPGTTEVDSEMDE